MEDRGVDRLKLLVGFGGGGDGEVGHGFIFEVRARSPSP
jgi:hypothetical protein